MGRGGGQRSGWGREEGNVHQSSSSLQNAPSAPHFSLRRGATNSPGSQQPRRLAASYSTGGDKFGCRRLIRE